MQTVSVYYRNQDQGSFIHGRENMETLTDKGAERIRHAAPDLLAACKSALEFIETMTEFKGMSVCRELESAIAKAEG